MKRKLEVDPMKTEPTEGDPMETEPMRTEEKFPPYKIKMYETDVKDGCRSTLDLNIDETAKEIRLVLTDCSDPSTTRTFTLSNDKIGLSGRDLVVIIPEEGKLRLIFENKSEAEQVHKQLNMRWKTDKENVYEIATYRTNAIKASRSTLELNIDDTAKEIRLVLTDCSDPSTTRTFTLSNDKIGLSGRDLVVIIPEEGKLRLTFENKSEAEQVHKQLNMRWKTDKENVYEIATYRTNAIKASRSTLELNIDDTAKEIRLVLTDCSDPSTTRTFTLSNDKIGLSGRDLVVIIPEEGKLRLTFENESEAEQVHKQLNMRWKTDKENFYEIAKYQTNARTASRSTLELNIDDTAKEIRLVLIDCSDPSTTRTFTFSNYTYGLLGNDRLEVNMEEEKEKLELTFVNETEAKAFASELYEFRPPHVSQDIVRAFDRELKEGDYFVELKDYLKSCIEDWVKDRLFAPIGTIVQSSGHGKSKSMEWFSRTNTSVYICLRGKGIDGFPHRSLIADLFMSCMDSIEKAKRFIAALIRTSLETVANIKEPDVPKTFYSYQPWGTLDSNKRKEKKFVARIHQVYNSNEEIIKDLPEKYKTTLSEKPLYVFVDEAASMLVESQEIDHSHPQKKMLNKFRVMRRAAKEICKGISVFFILAATNGRMYEFTPAQSSYTGSERTARENNLKMKEPFFRIWYLSLFVPPSDIENFNKDNVQLYEYISTRDRGHSLFLYGRPLWNSTPDAIDLAKSKLICAHSWSNVKSEDKMLAAIAVWSSRITLSSVSKHEYGKELVNRYMATLLGVDVEREKYLTCYLSEPILAEGAAQIMENKNTLVDLISILNSMVQNFNTFSSGPVGELMAQLVLLLAFDKAHDRKGRQVYSKPITVKMFIDSLVGTEKAKIILDTLDQEFREGLVYFTHFCKKWNELTYKDLKSEFLSRCAAVQLRDCAENIDLVIPIVLQNSEIGSIVIQVKNISKPKNSELIFAANNTRPHSDFCMSDEKQEKRVMKFLGLVMSLGAESDDPIQSVEVIVQRNLREKDEVKKTNFILRGLNVYQCLKEIDPYVKSVVNGSRDVVDDMIINYGYGEKDLKYVFGPKF